MIRYFVAANIWLVIAMILFAGRTYERTSPTRFSVFHGGQWLAPEEYLLLILVPFAISMFFFLLTWKTRDRK